MPRVCTVCQHADRAAIDRLLVQGQQSLRDIAGQFKLARSPLARHKAQHLADVLVQSHEAATVAIADDLVAELRTVKSSVARMFRALSAEAAEGEKRAEWLTRWALAFKGARSLAQLIELQAKLIGELGDGTDLGAHVHLVLPLSASDLAAKGYALPPGTTTEEVLDRLINQVRRSQGVGPIDPNDERTAAELLSPMTSDAPATFRQPRSAPGVHDGGYDERHLALDTRPTPAPEPKPVGLSEADAVRLRIARPGDAERERAEHRRQEMLKRREALERPLPLDDAAGEPEPWEMM